MEIMKMIALLISTVILLCACNHTDRPTLSYQELPFRAGLSWVSGGVSVGAILTSSFSDSDTKVYTLEFTSPPSLEGICVKQANEKITVTLGELEIASPEAAGWLEIKDLFEIEATVTHSSTASIDGVDFNYIKAISDTKRGYELYLFPKNGLPRRIISDLNGKPCVLNVLWFEFIK